MMTDAELGINTNMQDNERMVYCLQILYPNARNGIDYLVGTPFSDDYSTPGVPFITHWKLKDVPQPDVYEIDAVWKKYGKAFDDRKAAERVRAERNILIGRADILVNIATDKGDAKSEKLARIYRQLLRDVPQQGGFPYKIQWPEIPK